VERELQVVQLSATRCSCIAILWVSLASFAAITFCVASQRVFILVNGIFRYDSVRKLLDTPSYVFFIFPVRVPAAEDIEISVWGTQITGNALSKVSVHIYRIHISLLPSIKFPGSIFGSEVTHRDWGFS